MDIAAISIMVSQYKAQESAGILLMKKVMTSARQDGDALVEMVAQPAGGPVDPNLGSSIDEYV